MAEQVGKFLTELPELETPTDGDLMYIVDDETTSKKVTMANLKRVLGGNVTGTVEDASVSFSDGADGIPMEECEVTIVPTQDLHGYSKPWAGGAGKNKVEYPYMSTIGNTWNDMTISDNNGLLSVEGFQNGVARLDLCEIELTANTTYTLSSNFVYDDTTEEGTSYRMPLTLYDFNTSTIIANINNENVTFTVTENHTAKLYLNPSASGNTHYYKFTIKPMIEVGSQATTFEPYSNICPISGHTDVTVTVASTSGGSGEDTTVSLGRTVYRGTLDVTTGLLTVTHAITDVNTVIANRTTSYSNPVFYGEISGMKVGSQTIIAEAFNGIESKLSAQNFANNSSNGDCANNSNNTQFFIRADEYTDVPSLKTALGTTKIQYELATPQTFTLTKEQIQTLLGQNYVSHDGGGNIKVIYIRDLDIVINDLIDRVTALENE